MRTHNTHYFLAATLLIAVPGHDLAQQQDSGFLDNDKSVRDSAFSIIAHHYIDFVTIDSTMPLREIMSQLDPFSCYEPQAQYISFIRRQQDQGYGYGFRIHSTGGRIMFTSITYGGAADIVGLLPGDEVIAISGRLLGGNDSIALDMIWKSDTLDLTLFRPSAKLRWHQLLRRAILDQSSAPVVAMVNAKIGYISVTGFHDGTSKKLERAILRLSKLGISALIIDLRGNPDGLVQEAVMALSLFVRCDSLPWKGVDQDSQTINHGEPEFALLPLAVLVNNYSCSASEMFSGTLQDLDRAIIIGQPTVGKSLVMRFFLLPNKDRLYLAIGRYSLPSGRYVQRPYHNGLLIGGKEREFGSMDNTEHTFDSDLAETECPEFKTLGGRNVTGFAGIIPDYFVTQEHIYSEWLCDAIEGAAATYIRWNSGWLRNATLDSFTRYCGMPEPLVLSVLDTIRNRDTTSDKLLSAKLAWMVRRILKAYVASDIWEKYGFFMLWEKNSASVRLAAALLSKPAAIALVGK